MEIFAQILSFGAGAGLMLTWFAVEERCFAAARLFAGCVALFAVGVLALNLGVVG